MAATPVRISPAKVAQPVPQTPSAESSDTPTPGVLRSSTLWTQDMFFTNTAVADEDEEQEAEDKKRSAKAAWRVARDTYKSPGLLDPRKHTWMAHWDLLVVASLLFTAVVTPMEVAFMEAARHISPLWVVNRLIDLVFTVDCVLIFQTIYQETIDQGGHWVTNRRTITCRYLKVRHLVSVRHNSPVASPQRSTWGGCCH